MHFKLVFIIGRSTNKSNQTQLASEQENSQDTLAVDVEDIYNNLTLKVQLAMEYAASQCSNFDYVIKTDDDMYLNIEAISDFVSKRARCWHICFPIKVAVKHLDNVVLLLNWAFLHVLLVMKIDLISKFALNERNEVLNTDQRHTFAECCTIWQWNLLPTSKRFSKHQ